MGIEKINYIVGAKKNTDGTLDYSRAATLDHNSKIIESTDNTEPDCIFSERELQSLAIQLLSASEIQKKIKIQQLTKQKNKNPENILQEIRTFKKNQIKNNEKGLLRHYHRTSIENFRIIAEMGQLLSRTKLKKERPDIKIPKWSASDDVMMTRDKFDQEGKLVQPGFQNQEAVGASGSGVMLVINDNLIKNDNYDAIGNFPTISDLPLQGYCEAVLVDTEKNKLVVQEIISSNSLNIPVFLKSDWHR